jgi:hypothetical protein
MAMKSGLNYRPRCERFRPNEFGKTSGIRVRSGLRVRPFPLAPGGTPDRDGLQAVEQRIPELKQLECQTEAPKFLKNSAQGQTTVAGVPHNPRSATSPPLKQITPAHGYIVRINPTTRAALNQFIHHEQKTTWERGLGVRLSGLYRVLSHDLRRGFCSVVFVLLNPVASDRETSRSSPAHWANCSTYIHPLRNP